MPGQSWFPVLGIVLVDWKTSQTDRKIEIAEPENTHGKRGEGETADDKRIALSVRLGATTTDSTHPQTRCLLDVVCLPVACLLLSAARRLGSLLVSSLVCCLLSRSCFWIFVVAFCASLPGWTFAFHCGIYYVTHFLSIYLQIFCSLFMLHHVLLLLFISPLVSAVSLSITAPLYVTVCWLAVTSHLLFCAFRISSRLSLLLPLTLHSPTSHHSLRHPCFLDVLFFSALVSARSFLPFLAFGLLFSHHSIPIPASYTPTVATKASCFSLVASWWPLRIYLLQPVLTVSIY